MTQPALSEQLAVVQRPGRAALDAAPSLIAAEGLRIITILLADGEPSKGAA